MEDENDESWLYGNSEGKEKSDEPAANDKDVEPEKLEESKPKQDNIQEESGQNEDQDAEPEIDDDNQFQPAPGDVEDDTMQEAFQEPGDTEVDFEGGDNAQETKGTDENDDEDSDSDDDDDINVVIGDIKSGPTYIKHRGQIAPGAPNAAGAKQPAGKFNIEEFESVGTIAGVAAHEFSIDSLEDKPWRKPGADITDYFNYGFNEDTWRAYCERQKRFRVGESGVGLAGLSQHVTQPLPNMNGPGGFMPRRFGPPRFRHPGHINVIGGGENHHHHHHNRDQQMHPNDMNQDGQDSPSKQQPKENVIQVMTADRREYSRMNRGFGMDDQGPPINEPGFYEENQYNYMNQYEPTQDSQAWMGGGNPNWGPSGIKELTPGPNMLPPQNMPPPGMGGPMSGMPPRMGMPPGMNMPPNMGGPGGPMGIPSHMNAHPSQNSPRGGFQDRDRRDMGRQMDRNNDRMQRRRSRSPRSRSRDRIRRRSRSFERGTSKRLRSRSRERSKRPRSRSRERSKRPRSRSRERKRSKSKDKDKKRSKSRDKDRKKDKSDKDKDSKDKDKDKDKKDKKSHKKDKPEKDEKV
uniref:CSON006876 protein n=1 Tax=Culicoides sonorensis TaxID=179676 RepID=A0A336MZB6_CULSO